MGEKWDMPVAKRGNFALKGIGAILSALSCDTAFFGRSLKSQPLSICFLRLR